jgi:Sec-independent protein secretion pathway component TatC
MTLQALPIVALFEASIWLSVFFERRWEKQRWEAEFGSAP